MADAPEYRYYIDQAAFTDGPAPEIWLQGWCATASLTPVTELFAECEGVTFPCFTGILRPDVALHFDCVSMGHSGFAARVPARSPETEIRFSVREGAHRRLIFSWTGTAVADPPAAILDTTADGPPTRTPVFSLLFPAADVHPYYLDQCLRSLRNQTYPHWELCPAATPALALHQASGEYCALLHPTARLHPEALMHIVRAIDRQPSASLLYTDEHRIDDYGRPIELIHKQPFDSDRLLERDCIGQLACVRTSLARAVGGYHPEFGAAQQWDFLLRVSESTPAPDIVHIAAPLHLRRADPNPGDPITDRAIAARALARRNTPAILREAKSPGSFRVKYPLRSTPPTAVLLRVEDGPHQLRLLSRTRIPPGTRLHQISFGSVYPVDAPHSGPLLSVAELEAEIAIFLTVPLEQVNPDFFEELIAEAHRPECGIAAPADCETGVFAVATTLLAAAGGLAAINLEDRERLYTRLKALSSKRGLKIIRTAYASATLRCEASLALSGDWR